MVTAWVNLSSSVVMLRTAADALKDGGASDTVVRVCERLHSDALVLRDNVSGMVHRDK